MANLVNVFQQELDNSGNILNGGKIYVYDFETVNLSSVYVNELGAAGTNPVILSSSGRAGIFLDAGVYSFLLTDSSDNTIATRNGVSVIGGLAGTGSTQIVESMEALRALASGSSTYVDMVGYYTKGDQGAGKFYWDADATGEDGGYTIQPNSAPVTGRWLRFVEGPVTPYQFGAYGDGVEDDLIPINSAITYAYANDRVIYFPAGDYGVSDSIDLVTLFAYIDNSSVRNQGYFEFLGENPETTRFIPLANIIGALISLDADSADDSEGAANIRQIMFDGFSIYSDNSKNSGAGFSVEYGLLCRWVAELTITNFYCINAVTKRGISLESCFPVKLDNLNITGNGSERAPTGSNSPTAVISAQTWATAQPLAIADRFTGVYIKGSSTTVLMTNSRVRQFVNGINIEGCEMFSAINNAWESCQTVPFANNGNIVNGIAHGFLISGTATWFNLESYYAEGNEVAVGIKGTVVGGNITGSYIHDNINIKTYANEINGLHIHRNYIKGGYYGLLDQGAEFKGCSFTNNLCYVGRSQKDTWFSLAENYSTYVNRQIDVRNNTFKIEFTNNRLTSFDRHTSNLADYPLNEYSLNGDGTAAISSDTFGKQRAFTVTGSTAVTNNIERRIIPTIGAQDSIRGAWCTMQIPVYKTTLAGQITYVLKYSGALSTTITGRDNTTGLAVTASADSTDYATFDWSTETGDVDLNITCSWDTGTGILVNYGYGSDPHVATIQIVTGTPPTNGDVISRTGGDVGGFTVASIPVITQRMLLTSTAEYESGVNCNFTSSGTLPTGLTAGTEYILTRIGETTTYYVSENADDFENLVYVNYTDAGTGTHSLHLYSAFYNNYIYFKVPQNAEYLTLQIQPKGGTYTVGQPVIYRGLWDDNIGSTISERFQNKPLEDNTTIADYYDGPSNPTLKTIKMLNVGTPGAGTIQLYSNNTLGTTLSPTTVTTSGSIITTAGRIQGFKGADVASVGAMVLGQGNFFVITGTTTINQIAKTDWQAGSIVTLKFNDTVTVKYAIAGDATYKPFLLSGAVDFVASINDTLTLIFDGDYWREIARTVI
jgi:hypothetical protein